MKRKYYPEEDLETTLAKTFLKCKKKSPEKNIIYYRKSIINGIQSRCGKKRSYKNIKNEFTTDTYNIWFTSQENIIQKILDAGLTPSCERVNSAKNYCPENCIVIPNNLNRVLGKINGLKRELDNYRKYAKENLRWLPEALKGYYKETYKL
jgi:hypothetical protein